MEDFLTKRSIKPSQDILQSPLLRDVNCIYDEEIKAELLADFIKDVKSGNHEDPRFAELIDIFLVKCGLVRIMLLFDSYRVNDVVKLPDLLANCFSGKFPDNLSAQYVSRRVTQCIAIYEYIIFKSGRHSDTRLGALIAGISLHYARLSELCAEFIDFNLKMPRFLSIVTDDFLSDDRWKRNSVYKMTIRHCKSAQDIDALFGRESIRFIRDIMELLYSNFDSPSYTSVICYLRMLDNVDEFITILNRFIKLWADPVIAKADSSNEVVHYTQIIFTCFVHLSRDSILTHQMNVSKLLAEGLPNHFRSVDPQTLNLARFLSQFMIETFKLYDERATDKDPMSEETYRPKDELSQRILASFTPCCAYTAEFWYAEKIKGENPTDEKKGDDNKMDELNDIVDDDDDIEPIDGLDAPVKCKVVYVRDFLEKFPELKEVDEINQYFRQLEPVIRNQLALDHPETGLEVMDALYRWTNQYDDDGGDSELESERKACLCAALLAIPETTIPKYCLYFHQADIPRKNLILDVLSRIFKKLHVKGLSVLADSFFFSVIKDDTSISEQEPMIRIPLILLSARIIMALPVPLLKDWYLTLYLRALTNLDDVDHGTKQTIAYALQSVMKTIGSTKQIISPEVQISVGRTRDWLQNTIRF